MRTIVGDATDGAGMALMHLATRLSLGLGDARLTALAVLARAGFGAEWIERQPGREARRLLEIVIDGVKGGR